MRFAPLTNYKPGVMGARSALSTEHAWRQAENERAAALLPSGDWTAFAPTQGLVAVLRAGHTAYSPADGELVPLAEVDAAGRKH